MEVFSEPDVFNNPFFWIKNNLKNISGILT